jgi:hypothetical protein
LWIGAAGGDETLAPGQGAAVTVSSSHPLVKLDVSVCKNFPVKRISEKLSVRFRDISMLFRAEFFNIMKRANFAPALLCYGASRAQTFNENGTFAGAGDPQPTPVTQPREHSVCSQGHFRRGREA